MTNWECLSIEITIDNKLGSKLTVNNICNRPYDTIVNCYIFLDEFYVLLCDKYFNQKISYLVGDFNVDLIKVLTNQKLWWILQLNSFI